MPPLDFLTVLSPQHHASADQLFRRFTQSTGITVQGTYTGWDSIWRDLVQTGIYKRGPDMSEPGSTWLESLVEMNVLRPFTPQDIQSFGGEEAFIANSWEGVIFGEEKQVWGIPSRVDPRFIYYWKDMLDAAGLDPAQAFSSLSAFPDTFTRLQKVIETPWITANSPNDPATIQTLASWIWDAGGEFVSPDGKQVAFMEPATLESIVAYFDLHRFMPQLMDIGGLAVSEMFIRRKVAAVIGGPWVWRNLLAEGLPADTYARIAVAPIPAPSFMGGMTLVIFQHTRQEENAVRLVEFLVSPKVQAEYAPMVGLLPAVKEAWDFPPFSTDSNYRMMRQSIQRGRTFPRVPLWGTIEDRMVKSIGFVWNELLTTEKANARQVVHKHFAPLASRLNFALDR